MTDDDDIARRGDRQYEFSFEVELPPRDARKIFGSPTMTIDGTGLMDGEYRPCDHCDGLVEVDYYETHLVEEHGLEP